MEPFFHFNSTAEGVTIRLSFVHIRDLGWYEVLTVNCPQQSVTAIVLP